MNAEVNVHKIKNRFFFQDMQQDPDLERTANLRLIQLLAYAPPGAVAIGTVQRSGKNYFASIDVSSPFRSFIAKAEAVNSHDVVRRVLNKLDDQLFSWRFGNGTPANQQGYNNYNHSTLAGR